MAKNKEEEIKPVGKGAFGNIYDQFKGKVKEAIDFLMKHQEGDLTGVFHRDDIGDIDLVWGDENGGLNHIIKKHIEEHNDFKNIGEAIEIINDVIKNGNIVVDGKLRYKLKNGKSYTVTIRKDYDGVKKNWIVTAIDESRDEQDKRTTTNPTSTPQGVNEEGKPASPSSSSADKDTEKNENTNETEKKVEDGNEPADNSRRTESGSGQSKETTSKHDGRGNTQPINEREKGKEVDEHGVPFVLSSNGTTTFGAISEDSGLSAAPIKLSNGFQDETTGKGYGLVHMEYQHGEQIRNAGFASVKDFVSYIAKNYDHDNIRVGKRREDGNGTFLIQVTDAHDNTLFIELSKDGSYWGVNSGGVFRNGYSTKKEMVAKTEPQQPNNVVSSGSSLSITAQSDKSAIEPNGEPSISTDKDKQSSLNGNELGEKVAKAEAETNTTPTEAQKEAGNYKKGHVQVGTFDITIENPKGSERKGTDANDKPWSNTMQNTYGYFRGTEGVDGDHIDVFLADDIDGWNGRKVFVVDQTNTDGTFDEHKVMLGFNDADEAESAYYANYSQGWKESHPKNKITSVTIALPNSFTNIYSQRRGKDYGRIITRWRRIKRRR